MLNGIFIALILSAVLTAAFTGRMPALNAALLDNAKGAVEIALGLIGAMTLWLGMMRVLRDAGMMQAIARGLAPLMRRLFPEVPSDHPAMSAMILNIAANMLGLGNAATPFGLKAMRELDTLNARKGVASDAMVLFLAINTSGVAVLPLGVIAIRSSLGAADPGGIVLPSMLATACSTVVGVAMAKLLARRRRFAVERFEAAPEEGDGPAGGSLADGIPDLGEAEAVAAQRAEPSRGRLVAAALFFAAIGGAIALQVSQGPVGPDGPSAGEEIAKFWLLPLLMAGIVLIGFGHRVKVYDAFIQGAREGFQIAVVIIPFLVGILVAVGMFRASGAFDALLLAASPVTSLIGFPPEALPMALIRPLSGSGAMGVMTETMQTYGPDTFVGYLVSVMNGSTETTFYVLALYLGVVRVRVARHAVAACLCADAAGVLAALFWCRLFFG